MMRLTKSISRAWFMMRGLVLRRRVDAEIDEELSFHLEREAALFVRRGMSVPDARRAAALRFGGVERYREECREVRRVSWVEDFAADVHFSLRLVRMHPSFSANVILIAALGVAICATTFSVVSGILLSPLPFASPDRIAAVELHSVEESASAGLTVDLYRRLEATPVLEAVAASSPGSATVDWNGEPERLSTRLVTPSFFRVFGIAPRIGRAFTDDEATSHAPVVVLGYELWRRRFNSDPTVVGRRVTLEGAPRTIIGVTPARFRAHLRSEPDVWLPSVVGEGDTPTRRRIVNAVVRVADSVALERASQWLGAAIPAKMASKTFNDSVDASPRLEPIANYVYGEVKRPLTVLLGAVVMVLLLVAANVATMFLARSTARGQELSVRRALGASRSREFRQLVTEALTLTAAGGALGMLASDWAIRVIRGLGAQVLPRMDDVSLDWRVVLFAIVATIVTGISGGLAPALAARGAGPLIAADDASARMTGQRTSSSLVVAQIALSVVLLVGAGLLMKGFLRVLPSDPGFALENRAVMMVQLRNQTEFPDTDRVASRRFVADVMDRLRVVPGVRAVAAMSFPPFYGSVSLVDVQIVGRPAPTKPFTAFQNVLTPNFFDVLRMPLRQGRAFSPNDNDGGERVAIVNETAALRWWAGENPIGRQMTVVQGRNQVSATVVGVARDARLMGTDTKVRPEIYLPVMQSNPRYVTFVVHTAGDPRSIAHDLQRAVWSVAPRLPIGTTSDLATIASDSVRQARFFSIAMTVFAVVAIGLTGLGMYGLLAFGVAQRRREIGIRIALGAPARTVGGLVLRRAVLLGVAGVAIGTLAARWLSRYMESVLLEVGATDAMVFTTTAAGVLLVALVAACVPVIQALRVDPIRSLRV